MDMATKTRHVKAIIQLRRAKEPEWIEKNPVLRLGEPAYSTDVNKMKLGDGIKPWNELEYMSSLSIEELTQFLSNWKVEDLADGTDYATIEYVDSNAGKIASISINGVEQEIDENKHIDLQIPVYTAGNGLRLVENEFSLDDLILDCGTSTTVI